MESVCQQLVVSAISLLLAIGKVQGLPCPPVAKIKINFASMLYIIAVTIEIFQLYLN